MTRIKRGPDGRLVVELTTRDCYCGMVASVNACDWRRAELLARVLLRDATKMTPQRWLGQAAGVVARVEAFGYGTPEALGYEIPEALQ